MGKILQGGLVGAKESYKPVQNTQIQRPQEAQQPESWGQYAKRNIGGTLEGVLKGLEHIGQQFPNPARATSGLFGSQEYKQQPTSSEVIADLIGKPEGFGESRNMGEQVLRFGLGELPFWLHGGAFKSIPTAAKAIGTSLGMLGGAKAGGVLGETIGGQRGEIIGSLGGGVLGGGVIRAGLNRPTKAFSKKIYDKNVQEFEANKVNRLKELESETTPKITDSKKAALQERLNLAKEQSVFESQKKNALNKLQKEHHLNLKEVAEQDKINLNKSHEDYRNNQKNILEERNSELKQLKTDLENREKRIESLKSEASPLYEKASQESIGIKEPADNLVNRLDDIYKRVGRGIESGEKSKVKHMIKDIQKDIGEGTYNPDKGKIALDAVKEAQKNITLKLAEKNLFGSQVQQTVLGNKYKQIRNALNEFIEEVGKKHPEHAESYISAEQKAREYKELQRTRKDFIKEQREQAKEINENYRHNISELNKEFTDTKRNFENKQNIKDLNQQFKEASEKIKSEKFPVEKEIYSKQTLDNLKKELGVTEKDYQKARVEIGKETYDKLIKSEVQQNKLIQSLEFIKKGLSNYGLSGMGYYLVKAFGGGPLSKSLGGLGGKIITEVSREVRYTNKVFNEHPELFKEYSKVIKDAIKMDSPKLLTKLNSLGSQIESLSNESENKKTTKGRIISGGLK